MLTWKEYLDYLKIVHPIEYKKYQEYKRTITITDVMDSAISRKIYAERLMWDTSISVFERNQFNRMPLYNLIAGDIRALIQNSPVQPNFQITG